MPAEPLLIAGKLVIRTAQRVVLVHPPGDFVIADLPSGVSLVGQQEPPVPPADVLIAFFRSARELAREAEALAGSITETGALWLAWPRRAGGGQSDLTDNVVRDCGLSVGLVDVKVAALGEAWSSLRFVHRRADPPTYGPC